MNRITDIIQRVLAIEPALVISTVSGALLLAANLGLPVIVDDIDVPMAVTTAFNFVAIVATVLGIRQSVYSPATHEREVREAADDDFFEFEDLDYPTVSGGG